MKSKNIVISFTNAVKGIFYAIKTERNLKIDCVAIVLVLSSAYFLKISSTELAIIFLTIGIVICAEMVNTSIEKLSDIVSPEKNEKIGKVKDISAGAVLIVVIAAVGVAGVVFLY